MQNTLEYFISNYSHYAPLAEVRVHGSVGSSREKYPFVSVSFGNKKAPAFVMFGGVHGIERIGAQLTLNMLNSFWQRLQWDQVLKEMLGKLHVVFVPLVNPYGYFNTTRANANGVDLMRNAPIEIEPGEPTPFLLSGQRYSSKISWYRGNGIEDESKYVFELMQEVLKNSECVVSLDCHSGFGFKDQLWFPFANSRRTFTQLTEMHLFFELFEKTHPHHVYKIEPQSKNYLTHGDLWDYCFHEFRKPEQKYLPLTLEMGSWLWVKKNPLQLFSKTGLYNPIKEHRINRTLRRHRPLFDYILHSLYSYENWTKSESLNSLMLSEAAQKKYYG